VPGESDKPAWSTIYDLRVDEHETPVVELARLVRLRNAQLIDARGHSALADGKRQEALMLWTQARAQAPELEEIAFWQAVELADSHSDIQTAAQILRPVLEQDARQSEWIDLLRRMAVCGIIEREGAEVELIAALNA
jgi:uncharacterized Ntn-hydrolase superfamily protein